MKRIMSKYYIQRVELGEVYPGLEDKAQLFISEFKSSTIGRIQGIKNALFTFNGQMFEKVNQDNWIFI